MEKKIKLLFALIISIFLIANVSAFGMNSHIYIGEQLFKMSNPPTVIKDCIPYEDSYLAGNLIPDISIVKYYSDGGKDYQLMHNWNFANSLFAKATTPDQVCFAYGYASHLIQDSVAHNEVIPLMIEKTGIPNAFIHPLTEKKFDSEIVQAHPEILNVSEHVLDIMFTPKGQKYIDMMQSILGDNVNDFDVKSETARLAIAVGGNSFFANSYKPKGTTFLFYLYPIADKFTNAIQPFIGSTHLGTVEFYYEKAQELTINSLNNWGSRYQVSPHGFDALNEADKKTTLFNWLYILGILGIPIVICIWRKQFRWLWLIPLFFILAVLIVYLMI